MNIEITEKSFSLIPGTLIHTNKGYYFMVVNPSEKLHLWDIQVVLLSDGSYSLVEIETTHLGDRKIVFWLPDLSSVEDTIIEIFPPKCVNLTLTRKW